MSKRFQSVSDPATNQNFQTVEGLLPLGPQDLSDGAKELFLQLAEVGIHKVGFGQVEVEFPGASVASTAKSVAHGLGSPPVAFWVAGNGFSGIYGESNGLGTSTETEVRAIATAGTPGAGTKAKLSWFAIG